MHTLSRRTALALLSATALTPALAGCTSGAPSAADTAFADIAARALDGIARFAPAYATGLGDHRFDAEIDDVSAAGRAARVDASRALLAEVEALDTATLSRANQVDAAILANQLRYDIWDEDENQSWAWDPLPYNNVAGGSLYSLMAREFAPLPERLASATARMEKLPAFFAQMREAIVVARVPRVHAETLQRQNPGIVSIIDDLILVHRDTLAEAERTRLDTAATTLKAAVTEHQAWIDTTLVPGAQGDFRIGAERYDRKLALALNSPMSRADIKARAESELERITAEMAELAGELVTPPANQRWTRQRHIAQALELAYAERPSRANVVDFTRGTLTETTNFVREHDLITLPDTEVEIIIMPEFQRGVAVAYCDSPGALERNGRTFYAVSPIPDDWTDEQTQSFLSEYNNRSIHELTVHEAMPGHYVQLWHSNRYESTLRAALYSGPFVEGWACYAQDVMVAEGYYGDDKLARLVNLKWALRVIVNALLDQAIHVDGMEREAAMQLMTESGFQTEREAAGKWIRANVSSTQLPTYFVGWTEHHALRADAQERAGESFNLKDYHDKVLSFGSPPGRYVRALYFDEPIPA